MTMSGSIQEVYNYEEVEFTKGDTIVLRIHCKRNTNPCTTSIYGFYTGTLLKDDLTWEKGREGGKLEGSYTYEKAVFLMNIDD
jgi:hypothetical protein